MFYCVKRFRRKLNCPEHSADVDKTSKKGGKKTRRPVTDGIRSKRKKEELDVENIKN